MDFDPDYEQPPTRPDRTLYWKKLAALTPNNCAICSNLFRGFDDAETEVSLSIQGMFKELFACVDVKVGELKDPDALNELYQQQLVKVEEMQKKLPDFEEYFDDVKEGLRLAKEVVSCGKNESFVILEQVREYSNKIKEKLPKDIQL